MNAIARLNLAFDRAPNTAAGRAYKRARTVETKFARQLRKVAKAVADLISGFDLEHDPQAAEWVAIQLEQYARTLDPWAKSVSARMIAEMQARDLQNWREASARIGRYVRQEIENAPVGRAMQALLNDQTALITSIPREAAQRVRDVTLKGISEGLRPAAYVGDIMRTGDVTKSRATLIARTEVARTASVLSQVRAQSIGCTHFIWRTVGDSDVRPSHKALNGKAFEYANPPLCDPPDHHALPGQIWNCFPGETELASGFGIQAIYRAPFKGKVVDLVAGDAPISATENHPMLTARGWVKAGELHEGDYLVYAINHAKLVVDADENHRKPTLGEIFEAFSASKDETAARRKFDFHGDVPDGEVDEVRFNYPLSDDLVAEICQRVRDGGLADPDGRIVSPTFGGADEILQAGGTSLPDELAALAVRHAPHANDVRLTARPDWSPGCDDDAANDVARDLEARSDGQLTLACGVCLDDLAFRQREAIVRGPAAALDLDAKIAELHAQDVGMHADREAGGFESGAVRYQFLRVSDLRIRDYLGHVFTLQTTKGIYGVGNASAIVKNCRCVAEPIIPEF